MSARWVAEAAKSGHHGVENTSVSASPHCCVGKGSSADRSTSCAEAGGSHKGAAPQSTARFHASALALQVATAKLAKAVETSGPCSVTVLNGGSGPELQTIGDKRRQATHQCMQTCRFRLDHRQEGAAIAAGKILVIIENLCSRLDCSNPIQEFLFCILVLTQIQSSGDTSNLRHASPLIWAAWHELGRGEAWFFKRHFWKNQSKIYAGTTTLWQLCSRVDRPNFKDTPQNLRTVRSSLNCYTEIRRYRVVFHDDLMCLRTEGGPTNRVTTRRAALSAILHDVK